jgi:MFS transporter, DHA3 family, tetracycline resistance protein
MFAVFQRKPLSALSIYYILEGASALFFQLPITIYVIYYATTIGLDPFQIVLLGTVFETTIFLCEIPTGVIADVYSRRLSIIIGIALIGIAWLIAGIFPVFGAILLSEVISGIGVTFMSGATEAWITDEIGVERAGKAFIRASQLKMVCGIVGIGVSVTLASIALNLPFTVAGALLVGLTIFLIVTMPENGFQPAPKSERSSRRAMFVMLNKGLRLIRLRRILILILIIEFIYAFHSEGFDHLWQLHILDNFALPVLGTLNPVVWFGIINIGASLLGIVLSEIVRRRVDMNNHATSARALMVVYGITSLGIIVFALAGNFVIAVVAYWLISSLRGAGEPLSKAWLNQSLEPGIRATMFSVRGQTGAVGEIIGGPPIGAVASLISIRAALAATGTLLSFTLPLFIVTLRRQPETLLSEETA